VLRATFTCTLRGSHGPTALLQAFPRFPSLIELPQGIHENNHDYHLIDNIPPRLATRGVPVDLDLGDPAFCFEEFITTAFLIQRSSTIYNNDLIFHLSFLMFTHVFNDDGHVPHSLYALMLLGCVLQPNPRKMILMIARTIVPRIAMLPMFSATLKTRCHGRPPLSRQTALAMISLLFHPSGPDSL
jgi:hypothetical protein